MIKYIKEMKVEGSDLNLKLLTDTIKFIPSHSENPEFICYVKDMDTGEEYEAVGSHQFDRWFIHDVEHCDCSENTYMDLESQCMRFFN